MMAIFKSDLLITYSSNWGYYLGAAKQEEKASTPLIVVGGILIGLILLLFLLEFLGLIE